MVESQEGSKDGSLMASRVNVIHVSTEMPGIVFHESVTEDVSGSSEY